MKLLKQADIGYVKAKLLKHLKINMQISSDYFLRRI